MPDGKDLVIVTGGTGFIGQALMAKLVERYRVVNLWIVIQLQIPYPGLPLNA